MLTRNLFLTLRGHNVQRQLSKFLMRYQQFGSHVYCGAAGPVSKMAFSCCDAILQTGPATPQQAWETNCW
jgi:hypothetical protein